MVAWPDTWRSSAPTPLHLLTAARQRGERCALVTVLGIAGGAPRRRGAQLAVTEHGEVAGSLSGGCLDAAVIAEAHAARAEGTSRRIRFGTDSPYVDVVLPCGSGLDLQFDGALPHHTLDKIVAAITTRTTVPLRWESATVPAALCNPEDADVVVPPRMRLLIAGASENLRAVALLAAQASIEVLALTRDLSLHQDLSKAGVDVRDLPSATPWPPLPIDPWTAALTLFHEHESEVPFLCAALSSPAFVVGAMGSVRAHTQRLAQLRAAGVAEYALARLRGPFGLLSRTRDPNELAISMLAELWQHWRQLAFNEPE